MVAKKQRMTIHKRDGVSVLDLGEMDIWDGADLALLRETLFNLIEIDGSRSIGVDMLHVKYIPSGFFGMLYDWHDKGIAISLYTPQEHVKQMLWFRQFFNHTCDGQYVLNSDQTEPYAPATHPRWNNGAKVNGHGNGNGNPNGNGAANGNGNGKARSIKAINGS